jgi:GTP cyclohydrolase II
MRDVIAAGRGVVVYLRPPGHSPLQTLAALPAAPDATTGHPSRAPGLLVARGCSTADPAVAAAILTDLGVTSIRHLHNPPTMRAALDAALATAATRRAAAPGAVA